MNPIIPQMLGIFGLFIIVISFQCKQNRNFFLMQGIGSLFFFLNFILIGAYGGAFFNLANLIRGLLFSKDAKKLWKLLVIEAIYIGCLVFSIFLDNSLKQMILTLFPFSALIIMSVFMWKGNPKNIRYFQIAYMSPSWIVYNCFNLSVGGIICETFNMISSFVYLIIEKKNK
ncbi:MAG: YgjV family protein [Clostridia bacterium]|nr:YgjV family protein [Clostridia bacterium]